MINTLHLCILHLTPPVPTPHLSQLYCFHQLTAVGDCDLFAVGSESTLPLCLSTPMGWRAPFRSREDDNDGGD